MTDTKLPEIAEAYREPTRFERGILLGLQRKHVYQGYADDQVIVRPDDTADFVPDPRIAQTERRRAKNCAARKSRRINRIRGARR